MFLCLTTRLSLDLKCLSRAGQVARRKGCYIMRQSDDDGPVLAKLEVVCNNIVGVLLDLVVVMSTLDAAEVPCNDVGSSTGHNRLFDLVLSCVEACRRERDLILHCSDMLRLEREFDGFRLFTNGVFKQTSVNHSHANKSGGWKERESVSVVSTYLVVGWEAGIKS